MSIIMQDLATNVIESDKIVGQAREIHGNPEQSTEIHGNPLRSQAEPR